MSAQAMHTPTPVGQTSRARLAPMPGQPVPARPVHARRVPAVGATAPVTTRERPWDRVRFTGVARPGAEDLEDERIDAATDSWPAADRLAGAVARHAVEALLGARSPAQLARWLAPALYEALSRRVGLAARLQGRPPRVSHVTVRATSGSSPVPYAREVTVVLHHDGRSRAAAVRLETFRGRWRAVALEIG